VNFNNKTIFLKNKAGRLQALWVEADCIRVKSLQVARWSMVLPSSYKGFWYLVIFGNEIVFLKIRAEMLKTRWFEGSYTLVKALLVVRFCIPKFKPKQANFPKITSTPPPKPSKSRDADLPNLKLQALKYTGGAARYSQCFWEIFSCFWKLSINFDKILQKSQMSTLSNLKI